MITIDLRQEPLTVLELLSRAETDIVHIVSNNGQEFMLVTNEESFAEEVARLGNSEALLRFLAKRAKKPGVMSLSTLKQRVNAATVAGA